METKTTILIAVLAIAGVVLGMFGSQILGGQGELSTTGDVIVDPDTGDILAPWANKLVKYDLIATDKYTGGDVDATFKVYANEPSDWNDVRGDFDEAVEYNAYTASSGAITIDREYPGTYFVVSTAPGYNAEFFMMTIPNGEGRGDIADYQSNPDAKAVDFALVGSTTNEDASFTLVNASNKVLKETVLLTVAENTEFRGWKVIVTDTEGFSVDTNGNGIYDEGISMLKISVGSETYTVFDPSRGVDEFDSNDEFTFMLDNLVADEEELVIKIEIEADTGDYTGVADDEVWSAGEGILSYIKIYNEDGDLFATTELNA